jgi:hypothetical protein
MHRRMLRLAVRGLSRKSTAHSTCAERQRDGRGVTVTAQAELRTGLDAGEFRPCLPAPLQCQWRVTSLTVVAAR